MDLSYLIGKEFKELSQDVLSGGFFIEDLTQTEEGVFISFGAKNPENISIFFQGYLNEVSMFTARFNSWEETFRLPKGFDPTDSKLILLYSSKGDTTARYADEMTPGELDWSNRAELDLTPPDAENQGELFNLQK